MGQDVNESLENFAKEPPEVEHQRTIIKELTEKLAATDARLTGTQKQLTETQEQLEATRLDHGVLVQTIRVLSKVLPP